MPSAKLCTSRLESPLSPDHWSVVVAKTWRVFLRPYQETRGGTQTFAKKVVRAFHKKERALLRSLYGCRRVLVDSPPTEKIQSNSLPKT